MTRSQLLAALLLLSLPGVALATSAPSDSHSAAQDRTQKIESLERQFLATGDAEQRKHLISELKLTGRSSTDAAALNAAVFAMLPATASVTQAEELLVIAAAHPVGDPAGASPADDREFLVDARRAAQMATHPQGDVEALADIRVDRLGNDGLAEGHVQQLWRINTMRGARSFATHSIMYAAMSERLSLVRARVLPRDGGEVAATVSADQPVLDRNSSMYFDSRMRDLRFGRLQPGDLVEIDYRLLPASEVNPWAGYYARLDLFSDGYATRLRRRVLIAPSGKKLYAVEHGLAAAKVRTEGEETTRIWEMRDIASASSEALSPGGSSTGPYLHVSTIGSIEEFGRWYGTLLEPAMELDDNLRAVARQILDRNLTTQAKVQAVYESVQRSTRYVAFEFGVHSYQPYPLTAVEERGFGDCKDKAAMIVALLRAVGVEAEFAMVRTRSAGEIEPDAYSVQLFNHAVAYVPELDLFLDGTVEYASPGELPPDDQGAIAMTVDAAGKVTRRTVPFTPTEANRVTREVQARLGADGRVQFFSQTHYAGYFAAVERRSSQSADLAGNSRAALARFYPTVKIAHAVAEGTARASREVELKVDGEIDAVTGTRPVGDREAAVYEVGAGVAGGRAAGSHEVSLRSSLHTAAMTAKYAPTAGRRSPVLVPVTPSEREVFDYELPPGSEARLPADTQVQTPFGKIEVSYRLTEQKLRVETYTELTPMTVESADYAAFRSFCNAADEALQREVRIVLP
jgi:transglutaminase-like putative cysteine protease